MTPRDIAAHVLAEHDQASGFIGKDYRKYLCTCGADVGSDEGHRAHVVEALDVAGCLGGGAAEALREARAFIRDTCGIGASRNDYTDGWYAGLEYALDELDRRADSLVAQHRGERDGGAPC